MDARARIAEAVDAFNALSARGVARAQESYPEWRQASWRLAVDSVRPDLVRIQVDVVADDRLSMQTYSSRDAYPGARVKILGEKLLARAPGPGDLSDLHMSQVSERGLEPAELARMGIGPRDARGDSVADVIAGINRASVPRGSNAPGEVPQSRQARWQFAFAPGDPEKFVVQIEMANPKLTGVVLASDTRARPIEELVATARELIERPIMISDVQARRPYLKAVSMTPLTPERRAELLALSPGAQAKPEMSSRAVDAVSAPAKRPLPPQPTRARVTTKTSGDAAPEPARPTAGVEPPAGVKLPPGLYYHTLSDFIGEVRAAGRAVRVLEPGDHVQGKVLTRGVNTGDRGHFEGVLTESGALTLIPGGRRKQLDPVRNQRHYDVFIERPLRGNSIEVKDFSRSEGRGR